jgi:hypothetical protein
VPLSPPLPTRRWEDIDDVPLAILKKHKGQQFFTGFFSYSEMAALSLASMKDSTASLKALGPLTDKLSTATMTALDQPPGKTLSTAPQSPI